MGKGGRPTDPSDATHHARMHAMGLTAAQMAQPLVGVVTSWNEAAPANMALARQAQAVKRGVRDAGGTPREFNTIAAADGRGSDRTAPVASLAHREVIADSVELMVRGHSHRALVGLAGCDMAMAAMMMAMARLDIPSVVMFGGTALPGRYQDRDVTLQDVAEATGAHAAGHMDDTDFQTLVRNASPSAGAGAGHFNAHTMGCIAEALGLALPGTASIPAPYDSRDDCGFATGKAVMTLLQDGIRPRDILTRAAFENGAAILAATGGATNTVLHLLALAHECGIEFDLDSVAATFRRTPLIADLKPAGRYLAHDLHAAGGMPAVMRQLLDGGYLDGTCLTVTGRSMAENLQDRPWAGDQDVILPAGQPHAAATSLVVLTGNLAPDGALAKADGLPDRCMTGTARCFDCEAAGLAALERGDVGDGDVLVIRYQGPKGGPGMPAILDLPAALCGQGADGRIAVITDGCLSGMLRGPCVGHIGPEAALGGPIAMLRDGDRITIDMAAGRIDMEVSDAELSARRKDWQPPPSPALDGALWKYQQLVRPASQGAVTHSPASAPA